VFSNLAGSERKDSFVYDLFERGGGASDALRIVWSERKKFRRWALYEEVVGG